MSENLQTPQMKMGVHFERECVLWFSKKYDVVIHHGLTAAYQDMGIDFIAIKYQNPINIISLVQCKWSSKKSSIKKDVYDKMIDGLNFLLDNAIFYDKEKTQIELVLAAKYSIVDENEFKEPFFNYKHKNFNIITGMIFFDYEQGTSQLTYHKPIYSKNENFSLKKICS